MRSRIAVSLLAGTVGGLLGALLQEQLIHYMAVKDVLTGACVSVPLTADDVRNLTLSVGGLIGLFLGAVDGILEGNGGKLLRGMIVGAAGGAVLSFVGLGLGNSAFNMLGGSNASVPSPGAGAFVRQVLARSTGFAMLGAGIGIGATISTWSVKRIWHGLFGGTIGGAVGGFIFDLLAQSANPVQTLAGAAPCHDSGGWSRLVGFTLIGAMVGFFVGLVEELLKQAWVRVLAGRNEGRDFTLVKAVSVLGRDERAEVPLYGDASVAPQHAIIKADGRRHTLVNGTAPAGTRVNGQPVPAGGELLLRDGDMIQIAAHRVLFREKATARRFSPAPADQPRSGGSGPGPVVPSHLCPFCGAPTNQPGGCLCTQGGAAAPPGGTVLSGIPGRPTGPIGQSAITGPATRLVGISGPAAGQAFQIVQQETTLGREQGRDIAIAGDSTVSRFHARLVREAAGLVVYDNGSANGTQVNGQRVSAQPLAIGDVVQFGQSAFRVE